MQLTFEGGEAIPHKPDPLEKFKKEVKELAQSIRSRSSATFTVEDANFEEEEQENESDGV